MSIRIHRSLGRYDFCSNDKQALWEIDLPNTFPFKRIYAILEPDSELDQLCVENKDDPWELINFIEHHWVKHVLFGSNKEEQLAAIKWFKENIHTLKPLWLRQQIKKKNENIVKLGKEIENMECEIESLETIHLLKPEGGSACGDDTYGQLNANVDFVNCMYCLDTHNENENIKELTNGCDK